MASDGSIGTPSGAALVDTVAGAKKESQSSSLQSLGRWIRQSLSQRSEGGLKEALAEVLEEHEGEDSLISSEERTLLRNMVAFGELKVSDVMVPRSDIYAVPDTITQDDLTRFIAQHRHTRIPVYGESLDSVRGFIHIKDFFRCLIGDAAFSIADLKRDVLFVPSSMKIIDLLMKMRLSSCHMAIVVDEYGGTDGLVTMEDLFEEIVGEIQDEHDDDEVLPELIWINERVLEADARANIEDLSNELQLDLTEGGSVDDFDTLGGLIFSHLGRIPARGEVIHYTHGLKFEIMQADPRKIKKVRVTRAEAVATTQTA